MFLSKLYKFSRALFALLLKPSLVNHIVNDNMLWKNRFEKRYGLNGVFPIVSIDQFLQTTTETIHPYSFAGGNSMISDLFLLKQLCRQFPQCKYFEIGTWRGESVANCHAVAAECTTMNLSKDKIRELTRDDKYADQHFIFSEQLEGVKHIFADSQKYDFSSIDQKYDVLFIDGGHRYKEVRSDSLNVFTNLIHDESIIVWHDIMDGSSEIRYEVMMAIADAIPSDLHSNLYFVESTKCGIYTTRKLKAIPYSERIRSSLSFKIEVELT